ncbi:MAG: hypothetical protein U9P50_03565 [Patescibacteria group bacterium]|nr:hypothetical protein [Patescibacteria group bacterium]
MENTLGILNLEKKRRPWWLNQISLFIMFVGMITLIGWAAVSWMQIPYVHHSVSKNKAVAVFTADGKPLPLEPLPDRYEIINVK